MYIVIFIVNLILLFSLLIVYKRKIKKETARIQQSAKQEYLDYCKDQLQKQAEEEMSWLKTREKEIRFEIQQKLAQLTELNQQAQVVNKTLDEQREKVKTYEDSLRAIALESIKAYENDMRQLADEKVKAQTEEKLKEARENHEKHLAQFTEQEKLAQEELIRLQGAIAVLEGEIRDYTSKQTAINDAIMRQREIDEQKDFYRVCLNADSVSDIILLRGIRQNLKKPEIVDKIIYDNYVSKPVLEMVKRVLQNESFSGIYKITNLVTNEIYIGKSTDIKSRWQQHCKTAFNCGTIASSLLHTKMKDYGIENFTFEVVEKVPKDQLSEREKFYIEFYQTKEYGMNEKKGG